MSSFFKAIGQFFKSLWNALRKIIAIVLIIIAVIVIIWACIFCPPLGGVLFGVAFSSATMAFAFGCVLLVGAFLVDKETAGKTVGKIGDAVGDAAESVSSVAGNVLSGAVSGLFSSGLIWWVAGGFAAYYLLVNSGGDAGVSRQSVSKDVPDADDAFVVGIGPSIYQGGSTTVMEA